MTISQVKHIEPVWTGAKCYFPDPVAAKLIGIMRGINSLQVDLSPLALNLVAGLDYSGTSFSPEEATASFRALLRRLLLGSIAADDEDASSFKTREARATAYHKVIRVACRNCRLFVTEDGKIAQVGDVAAVFWGFKRPVMLRSHPRRDGYKLCDEVYIQDVMDGEWADAQMAEGRKEDVLHLH
ncbi:hypothetical protein LTR27_001811 [Elasticomyces elasticus]|nr:hypothetical protein LTR27_001811 [Elasticomyces elasticus]